MVRLVHITFEMFSPLAIHVSGVILRFHHLDEIPDRYLFMTIRGMESADDYLHIYLE